MGNAPNPSQRARVCIRADGRHGLVTGARLTLPTSTMAKHGKTHSHKKQHFVPQCYTKAWCDPAAPAGPKSSPYVWVFDRDGSNPSRKAPANLFTETDIYTIEGVDGERDLRLEHGFQELEDKFTKIRNLAFNQRKWPSAQDMAWLFGFVATAQARTQANRDHHREQWGNIRKRMEDFQDSYEQASPKQKKAFERMATPPSSRSGSGMTIEQVKELEAAPIQLMIATVVKTVMQAFSKMHVAVLCANDEVGFVTSDNPCTWFDPEAYKLPPFYRGAGLAMRTTEVTLPISPSQCLAITHRPELTGFVDVQQRIVDELNYRHIAHCNNKFISRSPSTRPIWFEERPMPDDSWEKERERKIASGEWPDR